VTSFTDADVQLVAQAISSACHDPRPIQLATAALAALADAGRLTPDGADRVEEWTYGNRDEETGHVDATYWDHVYDSRDEAEAQLAHLRTVLPGPNWDAVRIARRERITGPWVAADGTP
jgi:hypothetical protein